MIPPKWSIRLRRSRGRSFVDGRGEQGGRQGGGFLWDCRNDAGMLYEGLTNVLRSGQWSIIPQTELPRCAEQFPSSRRRHFYLSIQMILHISEWRFELQRIKNVVVFESEWFDYFSTKIIPSSAIPSEFLANRKRMYSPFSIINRTIDQPNSSEIRREKGPRRSNGE